MQNNITERVRKYRWVPREAEQDVVAAISSATGGTDRSPEASVGHRAVGVALPLLALAAGVALGYGGIRLLPPSPRRRLPPESWQRLADALRPILEAGKGRIPTMR